MTTYSPIANGSVDAGSPIDESLVTALRDNPIAIAEGASGAPAIASTAVLLEAGITAFPEPVVGDVRIYGGNSSYGFTEVEGVSSSTFGPTHTMLRSGNFRFRMRYSKTNFQGTCRMQLFKNGVSIYTSGFIGSTLSNTVELDVPLSAGDTWKVYWDEGSATSGGGIQVSIGCDALAATTISEICRLKNDGTTY